MNDPRQPLPGGAPRPAGIPQQQPTHAPQTIPGGQPRPVARPQGAPMQAPTAHPAHPSGPAKIAGMPTMPAGIPAGDEGSISLIEDGEEATVLHKKIKAFAGAEVAHQTKWKRQLANLATGPLRVRTFHAKLSDQGLEYLDEAINQFVDAHPEVDIKFVTTNVGMFDGKFKDFALIVNIWY